MKRMLVVLPVSFLLVLGGSFFVSAKGVHLNSWFQEQMADAKPQTADDPFSDVLDAELKLITEQSRQEIEKVQNVAEVEAKEKITSHSQKLQTQISVATEELKEQSNIDFELYTEQKLQEEKDLLNQDFTNILDEVFSE